MYSCIAYRTTHKNLAVCARCVCSNKLSLTAALVTVSGFKPFCSAAGRPRAAAACGGAAARPQNVAIVARGRRPAIPAHKNGEADAGRVTSTWSTCTGSGTLVPV